MFSHAQKLALVHHGALRRSWRRLARRKGRAVAAPRRPGRRVHRPALCARHLVLGRGAKARERCRSRAWHRRTRGAEWPAVKGAPLSGAEDRVVRARRRPRRRPLPDGAGRNSRSAAADAEVGRDARARTRPERVNAVMNFRRGNSVRAFRTLRYKCPPTRDENGVQGAAHEHGVKCAPS